MTGFCNIIGCDNKMIDVFRQIKDVSGYDYPVHIFGETGTGKGTGGQCRSRRKPARR
jgi:DNA-binding NtrC family response regulator